MSNTREHTDDDSDRIRSRRPSRADAAIGRRTLLATAGAAAVSMWATGTAAALEDAETGYGDGGYGAGGYGGGDGESVTLAVRTGEAADVTSSSAILNGELVELAGADAVGCSFEWRTADAEGWRSTDVERLESPGTFSQTLGGLEDGAAYEFRAVGETDERSVVGETRSFRTDPEEGVEPVIDRLEVTDRSNPAWARVRLEWSVSGGVDLESCRSMLWLDGEAVDSERTALDGTADSGEHDLRHRSRNGGGYEVAVTVRDVDGNEATVSERVSS